MEKEDFIKAKQLLHNTMGFTKEDLGQQIKEAIELTATNLVTKTINNNTSLEKYIEQVIERVIDRKIGELLKENHYSRSDNLRDNIAKEFLKKLTIDIKVNK